MPICGYWNGDPAPVAASLRDMPVWVFHSADDVVIPVQQSDRMVARLREAGNKGVKYTRYDTAPPPPGYPEMQGHNAYDLVGVDPKP